MKLKLISYLLIKKNKRKRDVMNSEKIKTSFRIADILENKLNNIREETTRSVLTPASPINLSFFPDTRSHLYPERIEEFYRFHKIPFVTHHHIPPPPLLPVDYSGGAEFHHIHTNLLKAPSHILDKYFYGGHLHPYSSYLLSSSNKRKGGQIRFTPSQTQLLEQRFSTHKYLSPEERRNLARQLRLSDRQVKTWFQNRRAKYRRIMSGQNKVIDPSTSLSKYRHISTYLPMHATNCANSSSSGLDLRINVNEISVDEDAVEDENSTDATDILERKHMDDMLQRTSRWIK